MDLDLLRDLDPAARRGLLAGARRRRFGRDEVVFHAGDPADSLHLLVAGRVAVRVETPQGDVATLTVLAPGATFGELALVRGGRRTATVVATEPAETLSLHVDTFERLRREHPAVDRVLIALLASYVQRQDRHLLEALYVPADRRVLRRLVTLAAAYATGQPPVDVPVTQDVLASMAGTTRPTANQALRALAAEGVITLGRGRIKVLDVDALRRRAG